MFRALGIMRLTQSATVFTRSPMGLAGRALALLLLSGPAWVCGAGDQRTATNAPPITSTDLASMLKDELASPVRQVYRSARLISCRSTTREGRPAGVPVDLAVGGPGPRMVWVDREDQANPSDTHGGTAEEGTDRAHTSPLSHVALAGAPVLGVDEASPGADVRADLLVPVFGAEGQYLGELQATIELARALTARFDPLAHAHDVLIEVLLSDGRVVYCSHLQPLNDMVHTALQDVRRPSKKLILQRVLNEQAGSACYQDFGPSRHTLETRCMHWTHARLMELTLIVRVERQLPFQPDDHSPLSGYWVGAYAEKESRPRKGEAVDTFPRSRQLNALILQDGIHCRVEADAGQWHFSGEGVMVDDRLAVAEVRSESGGLPNVWYWHAVYRPDDRALQGTIYGNARDSAAVRSFFLRDGRRN